MSRSGHGIGDAVQVPLDKAAGEWVKVPEATVRETEEDSAWQRSGMSAQKAWND